MKTIAALEQWLDAIHVTHPPRRLSAATGSSAGDRGAGRLEALVVTALPNILYLTNFTGTSAIVVVTADRVLFITDFRYTTTMAAARGTPSECPSLELVTVEGAYEATLALRLGASGWRRIGFEASHLTVGRFDWLRATLATHASPAPELVGTDRVVERARVRKDAYEIETLREAARRLSQVAAAVLTSVQRGHAERDVAFAIDCRIRQAGFERSAFETIVASGPNAALPHARPGGRTITEGDLVVLDFGGVHDSYCVDLTRTVSVGPASTPGPRGPRRRSRGARSRRRGRPSGPLALDIDAAAREHADRPRPRRAFGHGTGHGLGVEVHEDPRITRRRPDVDAGDEAVGAGDDLHDRAGRVSARMGRRPIEDDVLVTDDGVEVLTDVTTESDRSLMDLNHIKQILDLVREHELRIRLEHDGFACACARTATARTSATLPAAPAAPLALPAAGLAQRRAGGRHALGGRRPRRSTPKSSWQW